MTNKNAPKDTQMPEGFSFLDPRLVPVAVTAPDRDSVHTHRRNRHPDTHQFLGFLNTKRVEEAEGRRDHLRSLEKWLECLEMPRGTVFPVKEG
ncbi:uncharacterized protein B0T23DRAFT_443205 [Neurospora hispaniola]|uniref:Uncharacterized protein n=1 Tax=Neurospora hispaniola TaxID=588809 RepID=A0AAJ0I557_9PEZI|nr:hypothetical protein B0T23DRAFT_443205 [Neurospora hispaniola]